MRPMAAVAVDVIAIVLFAVAGRSTHQEAATLLGVFGTAWPFLVGSVVGHLAARSWRAPERLGTGVVVWLCTVSVGLGLRLLAGSTAQWPFVVVATLALGALLVGWRAAYRLIQQARRARPRTVR